MSLGKLKIILAAVQCSLSVEGACLEVRSTSSRMVRIFKGKHIHFRTIKSYCRDCGATLRFEGGTTLVARYWGGGGDWGEHKTLFLTNSEKF